MEGARQSVVTSFLGVRANHSLFHKRGKPKEVMNKVNKVMPGIMGSPALTPSCFPLRFPVGLRIATDD